MRFYIGLILLSGCINLSWADDFKLSFSQDIVNSADRQPSELDELPLKKPEVQDNPIPIPSAETKLIEPRGATSSDESEKIQASPAEREKSVSRVYPTRIKPVESNNNFLPVQRDSVSTLFGQGGLADSMRLGQPWYANEQGQTTVDPFDQLHDEIRLMVGEDMYAEMAWTYLDAKKLENWIYATVDQTGLFARDSLIVGLNDQLMASLTSLGMAGAKSQTVASMGQLSAQRVVGQVDPFNAAKSTVDPEVMKAALEGQSGFFQVLKYLTVRNLWYAMLSMIMLIYAGKCFKFFVRQH
jgi:hypothetical protein